MHVVRECNLAEIVVAILDGKTLVFPTETSYGLGCDATNQSAVDRIYAIKGRRPDKPLLVVVPSIEAAKEIIDWNEKIDAFASKHWPGPLTIVGKYLGKKNLAKGVVSSESTVAVRVTAHPLLTSITEKIQRPLVATSANISDTGDIYEGEKIIQQFSDRDEQPDIFFNYGVLPKQQPTTIVRIHDTKVEILRQGEIIIDV